MSTIKMTVFMAMFMEMVCIMAPGRVATGVPIFKSLLELDPEKNPALAGFEPGIFSSRGGRLNN